MNRLALALVPLLLPAIAQAQVTEKLSQGLGGVQSNGISFMPPPRDLISADGRFAAYMGGASNLVAGDTNSAFDVFLRDRVAGVNERVSVASSGAQGNADSGIGGIALSADGRFVAFESPATNLVVGDTNNTSDVFLRDRIAGTTVRISVGAGGLQSNGGSGDPSISSDGRYVCFSSFASNLVPGDANGLLDVFVRDLQAGTIELVSSAPGGIQGDGASHEPDITPDGRFVAFSSLATNFGGGPTSAEGQIYVRDRQTGAIELVSSASPGVGGAGFSFHPSLSGDGRFVSFASIAADLVGNDFNGAADIYVRDRLNGTTELVSVALGGLAGGGCGSGMISDDGRSVLFDSDAPDLVVLDTNSERDIFVRDLVLGVTERANVPTGGSQSFGFSRSGSISSDGRFVSFMSAATDLVPGETNPFIDVFLRDRSASGFESLCEPGSAGVLACPCANPPAGADRGCDNSAATGGAALSAGGAAYLAGDSLVFTTAGQTPSGTSVLVQGDAVVAGGAVFGQGVRCAGGTLTRLYVKTAAGGSIVAPDVPGGDLPVSVVSASLGDPIAAGQPRWYLVYYRDPIVLGGCSPASTFNATQTGRVSWFP